MPVISRSRKPEEHRLLVQRSRGRLRRLPNVLRSTSTGRPSPESPPGTVGGQDAALVLCALYLANSDNQSCNANMDTPCPPTKLSTTCRIKEAG